MKSQRKFTWKAFVSIGLLYAFIIIFLTGIVLYIAPAGRVSNWINWKILWLTKEKWQSIHTVFSFLFVILSIFHLFTLNWRIFWAYLKNKAAIGLNKKREFYIATVLTFLIFIGVINTFPPFSSVMDLGAYLKEKWEDKETIAPIPHAELLTLVELADKLDSIPVERIIKKLESNQIKFDGVNETLSSIGVKNNMPPIDIYNIIAKKSSTERIGSGIGIKSLEEFAKENNLDIEKVMVILMDNNIKGDKTQTLKDIAAQNDMAPKDIFELIKPK
ncbi:MAG TPA: glycoside hydrolase family 18 [Bacteroidales bacterium]|nr:glycoside hydrolase family 18 [Bacteroidales bacterium]